MIEADTNLTLETEKHDTTGLLHLTITPPKDGPRQPSKFICAIDTSSSMNDKASAEDSKHNFSRLDLVKHSIKAIINMLNVDDYLCLTSFSGDALLVFPMTRMSSEQKEMALKIVDTLKPSGCTNIWDGLKLSIDMILRDHLNNTTNNYIIVFTDGDSDIDPLKGIIEEMKSYIEEIPRHHELFTIHTFGYGYDINSKLLTQISTLGSGIFSFIPDSTMIGTNFVNFLANTLSTTISNAQVTLNTSEGIELTSIGFNMKDGKFFTGPIQYGQSRNFIFEFKVPTEQFKIEATLEYKKNKIIKEVNGITTEKNRDINVEWLRSKYCDFLRSQLIVGYKTKLLNSFKKILLKSLYQDDERVKAIIKDIESSKKNEGQVNKALSKFDWYKKWGCHYLYSLVRANQLQQCHNFKDPSVQIYGGCSFKSIQDKAHHIFCNLPVSKASSKYCMQALDYSFVPPDMCDYVEFNLSCFDGEGIVQLTKGNFKKVEELKKGDEVICSQGAAKVIALIKTKTRGQTTLVNINEVKLTPWHPIRVGGIWKFPCEIKKEVLETCEFVYNLVLDKNHILLINNLEVVTLGHGFKDNKVIEHPYFGSERVLEDLKKFEGWSEGNIRIDNCNTIRDPITHLVKGIIH